VPPECQISTKPELLAFIYILTLAGGHEAWLSYDRQPISPSIASFLLSTLIPYEQAVLQEAEFKGFVEVAVYIQRFFRRRNGNSCLLEKMFLLG